MFSQSFRSYPEEITALHAPLALLRKSVNTVNSVEDVCPSQTDDTVLSSCFSFSYNCGKVGQSWYTLDVQSTAHKHTHICGLKLKV